jgi:hypothetical protein
LPDRDPDPFPRYVADADRTKVIAPRRSSDIDKNKCVGRCRHRLGHAVAKDSGQPKDADGRHQEPTDYILRL